MSKQGATPFIKPIETVYAGYRFRSRLEARWAVVFNSMNLQFEYEQEGFELGSGLRYLPDFFLPTLGVHAEVKPRSGLVSEADLRKLVTFSVDGDKPTLLIVGTPGDHEMFLLSRRVLPPWRELVEDAEGGVSIADVFWSDVEDYGAVSISESPFMPGWCLVYRRLPPNTDCTIQAALIEGKQARFEHGEMP